MKLLAIVEVKLRDSVIVGNKKIRMPAAPQIRSRRSQSPTPTVDADLSADLFKLAIAQIVEKVLTAAIACILKAVGHDSRGGQMP